MLGLAARPGAAAAPDPRGTAFGAREYAGWAAASAVGAVAAGVLMSGAGYGWDGLLGRLSLGGLAVVAGLGVPFGLLVAWHVRQMPATEPEA